MSKASCLGFALFVFAACSTDLDVPDGATIRCRSNRDCPAAQSCVLELGVCADVGDDFIPSHVDAGSVSVTPTSRTRGTTATIAFRVDNGLKQSPRVRLLWSGGEREASLSSQDGLAFTFTYTVGDSEAEGPATLAINLVSDSGAPSSFELPRAGSVGVLTPSHFRVPN